jgi:hypothetical protein
LPILRELGEEIPEDELKAMLDEFDLDGDGESKFGLTYVLLVTRLQAKQSKALDSTVLSALKPALFAVNQDEFLSIMTADF